MNLEIVEQEKNRLVFELHESDHTVLLLIQGALEADSDVELATYAVDHPLVGRPKFIIETKKKSPKTVLLAAIEAVAKDLGSVHKDLTKQFA